MAKKRTHKDKEAALARRLRQIEFSKQHQQAESSTTGPVSSTATGSLSFPVAPASKQHSPAKLNQRRSSITDVVRLDVNLIKQDLQKTAVITVLLLGGIFGIFIYLR